MPWGREEVRKGRRELQEEAMPGATNTEGAGLQGLLCCHSQRRARPLHAENGQVASWPQAGEHG